MRPRLLRRTWARAALAPALAGALALAVAPALLELGERRVVAERGDVVVVAAQERVAPAQSATTPAPRLSDQVRPAPAPPADLSPLALSWRRAVVDGPRGQIRPLTAALRRVDDGREQLRKLADDQHDRVRAFALRELGARRELELREMFLAAREDPSPQVRENAQWALSQLEVR